MVNNQEWFNNKFPKRKETIDLKYEKFQGQLLIEDYQNLKMLYLLYVDSIERITLKNLVKLEECTIWECAITSLVVENCPKIKKLNVRNNLLTSLEFLDSLKYSEELDLDISCNNFSESDLEPFSNVINLNSLNVGNLLIWKILSGKYNRFFGSLEHLGNTNLIDLDISNTDIDEGLEYLPESLKKITCSNDFPIPWIKKNKCSQIVQELKNYWDSGNRYKLDDWRNNQPFYRKLLRVRNNEIETSPERNVNLENASSVHQDLVNQTVINPREKSLEAGSQIRENQENNQMFKFRKRLENLTRKSRRSLGTDDTILKNLLTAQKILTRAQLSNSDTAEIEAKLAHENLKKVFEEEITGSNLSWDDAQELCAAQEELMIAENGLENQQINQIETQIKVNVSS